MSPVDQGRSISMATMCATFDWTTNVRVQELQNLPPHLPTKLSLRSTKGMVMLPVEDII